MNDEIDGGWKAYFEKGDLEEAIMKAWNDLETVRDNC